MKFIVGAQLPVKLAVALTAAGHDAVHTLNLPDKNRSSDSYITRLADSEGRVVISKDGDFVTSHIVHGSPPGNSYWCLPSQTVAAGIYTQSRRQTAPAWKRLSGE